jgi:hypothetical protein
MKNIQKIALGLLASTVIFAACKKDSIVANPKPVEQELITTVRLVVKNETLGFSKTFNYKVDNGFNSSDPGGRVIDNVVLAANTTYKVEVFVLDESKTPAEDITNEVKEESHHHLFVFESKPTSGAGSIGFKNGSKDEDGHNFNQSIEFITGETGSGAITVTLKHEPTDKNRIWLDFCGFISMLKPSFFRKKPGFFHFIIVISD